MEEGRREVRTVRVRNISDLAGEREVREFFSFSGEIEHVDIRFDGVATGRTAYVTFKDPKALEIALLLSGATIVDQVVNITSAEDYIYIPVTEQQLVVNEVTSTAPPADLEQSTEGNVSPTTGRVYVSKAHDVMTTVIARGSAIRQDAVNKAKSFDEKHQLRANASARISSFDRRVGLSEKLNNGISVVNEKVKTVDQRLHVSDKTMAALLAAERKLNDTGSAVKTNRYVSAGTSWLNGAFSKVAKVGHVAGSRTRERSMGGRLWSYACSDSSGMDDPRMNPMAPGAPGLDKLACERVMVCTAVGDFLRWRGRAYAEAVTAARCSGDHVPDQGVELLETEGEGHVFYLFKPDCDKAKEMLGRIVAFVNTSA